MVCTEPLAGEFFSMQAVTTSGSSTPCTVVASSDSVAIIKDLDMMWNSESYLLESICYMGVLKMAIK
jgi:hypothetical protein